MAIVNRDLDASQTKEVIHWMSTPATGISYGLGVGTGVTIFISGPMPYPGTVQSAQAVAIGRSGAPELVFSLFRPANGNTVVALGISNLVIPNGLSAAVTSYSGLAATGSTLLNFQRGDMFMVTTAGANTACTNLVVSMVVKKTQDIVTHNGTSL